MANNNTSHSLVRQTVDDLIIAELFLVQATIESATAIGDGLSTLGRQITRILGLLAAWEDMANAAAMNTSGARMWR